MVDSVNLCLHVLTSNLTLSYDHSVDTFQITVTIMKMYMNVIMGDVYITCPAA